MTQTLNLQRLGTSEPKGLSLAQGEQVLTELAMP
ncbi:hypothetical protein XM38_036920 [Halomicronema hongdechloris C2206]|uniref:Uncharacterized protein n=1 Tax=Halomicronema hongdechloris C2206 TaxID=1641165 RepID=A0A1Z3HQY1_9CYAN|nr:hypothetical protein XM38_036920 [Halomicronema hongdechloris C2206]